MKGRLKYSRTPAHQPRLVCLDTQQIDGDWALKPIGRLMPRMPDSRQQPKSLAHKLLDAQQALQSVYDSVQARRRHDCTFIDAMDGTVVKGPSGNDMGLILPKASAAVLAASPGIQSWSTPNS